MASNEIPAELLAAIYNEDIDSNEAQNIQDQMYSQENDPQSKMQPAPAEPQPAMVREEAVAEKLIGGDEEMPDAQPHQPPRDEEYERAMAASMEGQDFKPNDTFNDPEFMKALAKSMEDR